nr:MAG TPA: hypothetical protein [Caudoviricetes sp.]
MSNIFDILRTYTPLGYIIMCYTAIHSIRN